MTEQRLDQASERVHIASTSRGREADGSLAHPRDFDELAAHREQIRQTRAELGKTIDRIQERLSPQHLRSEAKEVVRERIEVATSKAKNQARDARQNLVEMVKEHPMPAMVLGLGLAWVALLRQRGDDYEIYAWFEPGDDYEVYGLPSHAAHSSRRRTEGRVVGEQIGPDAPGRHPRGASEGRLYLLRRHRERSLMQKVGGNAAVAGAILTVGTLVRWLEQTDDPRAEKVRHRARQKMQSFAEVARPVAQEIQDAFREAALQVARGESPAKAAVFAMRRSRRAAAQLQRGPNSNLLGSGKNDSGTSKP